jgi:hypothetical protein
MAISFCEMVNCGVTGLGVMSWEVPVASVRHGNFDTLQKIMKTGFPYPKLESAGMNGGGPDIDRLVNEKDYLEREYPEMAYFKSCKVVQRGISVERLPSEDHPSSVQIMRPKIAEKLRKKRIEGEEEDDRKKERSSKEEEEQEEEEKEEEEKEEEEKEESEEGAEAESPEERNHRKNNEPQAKKSEVKVSPPADNQIANARPVPIIVPVGMSGADTFKVSCEVEPGEGDSSYSGGEIIIEVFLILYYNLC